MTALGRCRGRAGRLCRRLSGRPLRGRGRTRRRGRAGHDLALARILAFVGRHPPDGRAHHQERGAHHRSRDPVRVAPLDAVPPGQNTLHGPVLPRLPPRETRPRKGAPRDAADLLRGPAVLLLRRLLGLLGGALLFEALALLLVLSRRERLRSHVANRKRSGRYWRRRQERRGRGGDRDAVADGHGGALRPCPTREAEERVAAQHAGNNRVHTADIAAPPVLLQHHRRLAVALSRLLVDLRDGAAGPGEPGHERGLTDGERPPGVLLPWLAPGDHDVGTEALDLEGLERPVEEEAIRRLVGHEHGGEIGQ